MTMTYTEAVKAYFDACQAANGHTDGLSAPRELQSEMDRTGRWILRNTNGFLAYVTTTGQVLNQRFQPMWEM